MAENKPKLPAPKSAGPKLPTPTPTKPVLPTPPSGVKINQAVVNRGTPMRPVATPSTPTTRTTTGSRSPVAGGYLGYTPPVSQRITPPGGTGTKIDTGRDTTSKTKTILRTEDNGDGTYTIYYSDGTTEIGGTKTTGGGEDPGIAYARDVAEAERKSAFAVLQDTFRQYGLDDLASEIQNYMLEGISSEEATLRLRQSQPYKLRFKGNEGRIAKGLAAYSPAEYLQAEETYRNLLASSGLGDLAVKENFATLIGGAVSALEAQDRIQNVFNKIDNADPALKQQLNQYFRAYGVGDASTQRAQVAKAILTGDTSAQSLERSLKKAQLRTGAAQYAVNIAEANIESLQQQLEAQGVSDVYGAGQAGFQTLSQTQAEAERLASIYKEPAPLSEELQQEAFFGLASQRRKKLQEKEQAAFAGRAGTTEVSLGQAGMGTF